MQRNLRAFASEYLTKKARQPGRVLFLFAVAVAAATLLVTSSHATGNVGRGDLAGPWMVTLVGTTGCGQAAMQANFTLNGSATTNNATLVTHGGCGDSTVTGQTFTVNTLNANGSGTAGLSCGTGCGWTFNIQVSADRSTFNLVDVSTANPNNYIAGTAVHQ
jgi:hypothetical protein